MSSGSAWSSRAVGSRTGSKAMVKPCLNNKNKISPPYCVLVGTVQLANRHSKGLASCHPFEVAFFGKIRVECKNLNPSPTSSLLCCYDETLTKSNLGRKGFVWLTHPIHSPSLREVRAGTQKQELTQKP